MLSDFVSILEKIDLEEVTDLDKRCLQILFYLLLNSDNTFNHNQLMRNLNEFGFNFQDPTYSRHLNHLEDKKYIIREKNHTTTISLNIVSIESKSKLKNAVKISLDYLNLYKEEASDLNNEELFKILKQYCMEKVSSQFLIKLKHINKSIPENQFHIGYLWSTLLYDYLIELYLDEVRKRGNETVIEQLDLYYKDGKKNSKNQ
ncbi:MAG: hypothetical protein ACTSQY_06675 [Candidatus Odinarchaeia archaeon]